MENTVTISVAKDFSINPGTRYIRYSKYSGQEFRQDFLEKYFIEESLKDVIIIVDLDGVNGYGPSFIEEVFGGLVRRAGRKAVLERIRIQTEDYPYFKKKAEDDIAKAKDFSKKFGEE